MNLRREAEARGPVAQTDPCTESEPSDYSADIYTGRLVFGQLSAGTLVVRCSGKAGARMAGGILNAMGLSQLITSSLEEYERLALKLARNGKALAGIRAKIAQNLQTAPLFLDQLCDVPAAAASI